MAQVEFPSQWQLACAYARLVDRRQFDALATIMFDDIVVTGPGFDYRSLAAFREGLAILERYDRTFHLVGNQSGEWRGDDYEGETYCVASHIYRTEGGEMKLDMGIRYRECIARRNGACKYTERHLDVVFVQDLPLTMTATGGQPQ